MSLFACCGERDKSKGAEAGPDPVKFPHVLAVAACNGDMKLVETCIAKGYSVDAPDAEGSSPLTAAAWGNHPELVRFLIQQGANVDAANEKHGWTALISAASKGHMECARILIEEGKAGPLIRDHYKQRAEDYAMSHKHYETYDYVRTARIAAAKAAGLPTTPNSSRPSSAVGTRTVTAASTAATNATNVVVVSSRNNEEEHEVSDSEDGLQARLLGRQSTSSGSSTAREGSIILDNSAFYPITATHSSSLSGDARPITSTAASATATGTDPAGGNSLA